MQNFIDLHFDKYSNTTYVVNQSGCINVCDCNTNPGSRLEYYGNCLDQQVTCITSVTVHGLAQKISPEKILFVGLTNGQIALFSPLDKLQMAPVQAHVGK